MTVTNSTVSDVARSMIRYGCTKYLADLALDILRDDAATAWKMGETACCSHDLFADTSTSGQVILRDVSTNVRQFITC
jgi:hypothetical protein